MSHKGLDEGRALASTGAWWLSIVGAVVALVGGAVALWGLLYLRAALVPDNRTNPLRQIGVVIGTGASGLGAIAGLGGLALVVRYRPTKRGSH